MSTALILHSYSRDNAGDGLLVDETVSLTREALGPSVEITLVSSRPESFRDTGFHLVDARPRMRGYSRDLLRCLTRAPDYDLVVGVGGGYLRAGYVRELLKTTAVHLPQLVAASRAPRSIYLSQSIGPLKFGSRRVLNRRLARLGAVLVRDDRSAHETGPWSIRMPDLAILSSSWRGRGDDEHVLDRPVLSVRAVRGRIPKAALAVAERLPEYDTFVQSRVGSNDDGAATEQLSPVSVLTPGQFLKNSPRRVVIAVRLHAALMALQAGHYVIHLSYERKGFGAFADLGLDEYVHNCNFGDAGRIAEQAHLLMNDRRTRRLYDETVTNALGRAAQRRREVVDMMRLLSRRRS